MAKAKDKKPIAEIINRRPAAASAARASQKRRHIEQRDIIALIPETVENAEVLDALYTELADLNIEITTTGPDPENFTDEWAEEDEPRR